MKRRTMQSHFSKEKERPLSFPSIYRKTPALRNTDLRGKLRKIY